MTTSITTSETTNAIWILGLLIAWIIVCCIRGLCNGYHRYLELTGTDDYHCSCGRVYHSAERLDRHVNRKHR